MKPQDFANTTPRFVVEEYFAGKTKAWGIFEDRFGTLRRDFIVEITGTWDGKTLVLDEDFTYSDGEKDRRVWSIVKKDEHTYEGTAADVVGTATGLSYGKALNWRYDLNLKVGDGTWRVAFDDWMFLADKDTLINRARVSKFGVEIGQVTLFFRKEPSAVQRSDALDPWSGQGIAAAQ
ncbi:MAG: DUF3833 domain-containing protein [Elstera sp.]